MRARSFTSRLLGVRELVALSPLIVAIVVSVAVWTALFVMPVMKLLGWPIAVAALWAVANYFFEIIDHRARGGRDWPILSLEAVSSASRQKGIVFTLVVSAAIACYFLLIVLEWQGVALIFAVSTTALLPASAALLAVTRSLRKALDPGSLMRAVWGIGWWYLLILLGLAVLLYVANVAASQLSFVAIFLTAYGFLLLAYLIGSILYARRRVLGVHAPRAPEVRAAAEHEDLLRERRSVLAHAYAFAGRGNVSGALAHIEDHVETEADPLVGRIWMFHEISRWEIASAALAYGDRLIDHLEEAGLLDECAKVRTVCEHLRSRGPNA